MTNTALSKKLLIKAGYQLLVLNAPEGYLSLLGDLPAGVTLHTEPVPGTAYDLVQTFIRNISEVLSNSAVAIQTVKPGGLVWLAYPKKSGKITTDLSRDVGWNSLSLLGWQIVTLISIDPNWSCFRVKPKA